MTMPQLQFFSDDGYEDAIQILEHSSDHRILRRVDFPAHAIALTDLPHHERCIVRNGIFLDTETTGMDHETDEVIQLCMMPFRFAVDGETKESYLIEVQKPYIGLREPGKPVPEEIVQLTGITNEMLKGQSLDLEAIEELIAGADIIAAHNAKFDRPFAHKITESFAGKYWGCSISDVNWAGQGFESMKLSLLAVELGMFFDAHQADKDCLAALAILAQNTPEGDSYFSQMITGARTTTVTLRAQYTPFETKDLLKTRGYYWRDGSDGTIKGWEISVPADKALEEKEWLQSEVYGGGEASIDERELTGLTRFSK
ncbi:3'-5' exonuclease [Emcibacter nanhaiensis]|uniref:Exonuclease domain-containing protein n=1 Tax=Emcibacter nanhaiensis TaxID=1505037 RepID=A0A501PGX3_9PROT|nr:3'-5' exonuclease [Emcibacter nanhaiensis]TPD59327.1 hypothetical protein FIV46_11055 [Emcibacter nanhaiensis]